jgi:hypothetical protein
VTVTSLGYENGIICPIVFAKYGHRLPFWYLGQTFFRRSKQLGQLPVPIGTKHARAVSYAARCLLNVFQLYNYLRRDVKCEAPMLVNSTETKRDKEPRKRHDEKRCECTVYGAERKEFDKVQVDVLLRYDYDLGFAQSLFSMHPLSKDKAGRVKLDEGGMPMSTHLLVAGWSLFTCWDVDVFTSGGRV